MPSPGLPIRLVVPALMLLALPRPALATWSLDPSAPTAPCSAAREQTFATGASDGERGLLVAWQDHRDTLTTGSDIYIGRITGEGTTPPGRPVNGLAVCTAGGEQLTPLMISDGAGGALVSWCDERGALPAIYAQHVLASGVVDPAWPVNGRAVHTGLHTGSAALLASDGAGGAFIQWRDDRDGLAGAIDLYAHHVLASGALDSAWPASGLGICTASGVRFLSSVLPDGSGGELVAWQDQRGSTAADLYASHVLAGGAIDPAVAAGGTAVCTAPGNQFYGLLTSDGSGGAFVVWTDARNSGSDTRIYAHHLRHNGTVFASWPANGMVVSDVVSSFQNYQVLTSDGATGFLVSWSEYRASNQGQVYTQHVLANATVDPGHRRRERLDHRLGAWPHERALHRRHRCHVHRLQRPHRARADDRERARRARGPGWTPTRALERELDRHGADATREQLHAVAQAERPGRDHAPRAASVRVTHAAGTLIYWQFLATVPAQGFAGYLERPSPNPARGDALIVRFSLPDAAPARVELLDVGGRRAYARDVGALGAGPHSLPVAVERALAPGVYLVRLTRAGETRTTRVAVVQ